MIAICICILCAITIFLTWRTEITKRETKRLKDELYVTQVQLERLRSDVEDLKYKQ